MEAAGPRGTRLEVGEDGVAVITIFNPPINCFTFDMFASLANNYGQALARDDVKAIVITGEGGHLAGGFDINEFSAAKEGKVELPKPGSFGIDVMTDIFEVSNKPAVAAIDGLCIGGGLEVSMTCHARVSTAGAKIGLPELSVGLITGLGGSQRLPRLVGVTKALDMLLSSQIVSGEEAHELGIVDAVVAPNELLETARRWALDIAESRKPWNKTLYRTDKLEPVDEIKKVLNSARSQAQTQAAKVCIDVVEVGVLSDPRSGLWKETEAFGGLLFSDDFKMVSNSVFA